MVNPIAVVSGVYFICAAFGHDWCFVRTSRNFHHYECFLCERKKKEER